MLEFCDGRFTAKRVTWQWELTERWESKDKDGNLKPRSRETYHSNLSQVCSYVIDKTSGDHSSPEELITSLDRANKLLTKTAEDSLGEK